jgi:hypothetical protein
MCARLFIRIQNIQILALQIWSSAAVTPRIEVFVQKFITLSADYEIHCLL